MELLSLLRSLKRKTAKDEGSKAAMSAAMEEVQLLCKEICNQHVIQEACAWVSSQAETLEHSRIMSKPPSFDVMKVGTEYKNVFSEELQILVDLSSFYAGLEGLAVEVDAILRMSVGDVAGFRASVLKLCKMFQRYEECKNAVLVTCPGMFMCCASLSKSLDVFVNAQCIRAWREALSQPLTLLLGFVKKSWSKAVFDNVKQEDLKQGLAGIADACLLATGFDQQRRAEIQMSTKFVEAALKFAQADCDKDSSDGNVIMAVHQIFVVLGLTDKRKADSGIPMETAFASEKIQHLGSWSMAKITFFII